MTLAYVNGLNLYYEEHGAGEPLILIAGFSVDHRAWQPVIEPLSRHYRVIVFDNRGSGQSDCPPGPYSIDMMAQDAVSLLDELSISQAHIIGNSMGGLIVQQLIGHYSHRVKSAVITNSVARVDRRAKLAFETRYELLQQNMPLEVLIKDGLAWCHSSQYLSQPGQLDRLVTEGLKSPVKFSLSAYQSQLAAMVTFDSTAWLEQITVPCLVVGGDEDMIFPPRFTQQLAQSIKGAEYVCFDQCGHLPFVEYPQEFCLRVNKFLVT